MVQHRPTPAAACRTIERGPREGGRAPRPRGALQGTGRTEALSPQGEMGGMRGAMEGDEVQVCPASLPPSSRRYLVGRRGDAGCPLCARRARGGATLSGLGATSYHFLTATWVVLMVGEPSPSQP